MDDAPHDHDFVRKLLRRPAREDCRHEAAQKMPRSILQQPSFTKFLLFWFSLLFLFQTLIIPHFTCGCGVEGKFIKFDLSAKVPFLKVLNCFLELLVEGRRAKVLLTVYLKVEWEGFKPTWLIDKFKHVIKSLISGSYA